MAVKTLLATPAEPEHPGGPKHPAWCVDSRCGGEHYSAEVVVPGKRHYYVEILQNDGEPEPQVSILDGMTGGPNLCVSASAIGGLIAALLQVNGTLTGARQDPNARRNAGTPRHTAERRDTVTPPGQ